MKIAILSTFDPFIKGGGKLQFQNLYKILKKQYENVELFFLPANYNLEETEKQINSLQKFQINSDILITSRPLSYYIKHPNKIIWFMHHISYFYEFSNTKLNPYINHPNFHKIKQQFIEKDTFHLKESKKIFSISKFVSEKLKLYNQLSSQVLYPPLLDTNNFFCNQYSDYFFLPSLITFTKRQHLVIEALLYTKNPVKLILAGQIDVKYYKKYIKPLLKNKKISQNLQIIPHFITQEKYNYYANCLDVVFTPINEAFGYVILESFFSSKPVITTNDSGGPTELIKDNINGFVSNPSPQEIAQIMDTLYENRNLAMKLGKEAYTYANLYFNPQKSEKEIIQALIGG